MHSPALQHMHATVTSGNPSHKDTHYQKWLGHIRYTVSMCDFDAKISARSPLKLFALYWYAAAYNCRLAVHVGGVVGWWHIMFCVSPPPSASPCTFENRSIFAASICVRVGFRVCREQRYADDDATQTTHAQTQHARMQQRMLMYHTHAHNNCSRQSNRITLHTLSRHNTFVL